MSKMEKNIEAAMAVIKVVPGEIARIVDEAQEALLRSKVPLFVRGGRLVEPVTIERKDADGRKTNYTYFAQVGPANLRELLNKHAAIFTHFDKRKKGWIPIDPPQMVLTDLHALNKWRFPEVAGIVTAPTMRPDGSVLDSPGYDPATRLWCASEIVMPEIPEKPSRKQALVALKLLEDLLLEFQFVGDVDRAVALAALMTVVLRGAFDNVPVFLITAHTAGEGKSFFVDLCACITTGRNCPAISACESREELEKRLSALLLEGPPIATFDNVSFDLKSDLLCTLATQQYIKVRILGKSEVPECEWLGTLFCTGNNIALIGDMVRRALRLQLDAKVERPERREFKSDPRAMILGNRGAYVAAALTIARAYIAAGEPKIKEDTPIASFERWSRKVRQPLMWLGVADPAQSMDALRDEDPELNAAEEFLTEWRKHLGVERSYKASEVIEKGARWESTGAVYPNFLALLCSEHCGANGKPDAVRLGFFMKALNGRIFGGMSLTADVGKGRTNRYQLHASDDNTPM